ncbi:unnamed protein product [Allacma fusca]|uniref:Peptidase M12A domain-containing protein n=1 Tax=Allacma fusca TaxID=39272 RepID=A0A8J2PNV9_9HEXA|nr:unnamed protein product [Allacma fusca]
MLFALALLQVGALCSEVYVSAETQLPYLTAEDFARAANLQPALSDGNFSNSYYTRDNRALPETKLAWKHAKWDGAVIPYTLDEAFTSEHRAQVAQAMTNYQSKTCVRFVPRRSTDNDYVHISRDDKACGLASLCKEGGRQIAKFGGSCITSGVMSHELGHTLCFMHEQTRPDRDDYISWNTSICTPHEKVDPKDWTTLDLLYDYVSLQHYEGECYNGCIIPKMTGVTKCGSGGTPSVLDIEKINSYYDCQGCYSYRFRAKRLISYSANDRLVVAGKGVIDEDLYPCRAYHNGDIVPGKGDSYGSCFVPYNGAEYYKSSNFEVLSNPKGVNLVWRQHPKGSPVPANAIRGGRTAERETLYIGRCTFTDQKAKKTMTIPGKYHPSASDQLYIPYGGGEYKCEPFDLLVCQ